MHINALLVLHCTKCNVLCYSHINEDRRKTEGQMQMFEVLRDIDECPVS